MKAGNGGSPSQLVPVAFYGRKNVGGADGAEAIARQFRVCHDAAAGRAIITHFFYDFTVPPDDVLVQAVQRAGGPPRRDGGWDDLVTRLRQPDRDFHLLLCTGADRISRNRALLARRLDVAGQYGLTVLYVTGNGATGGVFPRADGLAPAHSQDLLPPASEIKEPIDVGKDRDRTVGAAVPDESPGAPGRAEDRGGEAHSSVGRWERPHRLVGPGGRLAPADIPEMTLEIKTVGGAEGTALARAQTQVIKEVVEWLAQRRSGHGENPAA